jgi:Uma2 family endonuclease
MSERIDIPTQPMTVQEFYAWADRQPNARFELVRGHVLAMAPELIGHARAKFAAALALRAGIRAAGLPCEAFVDGVGIQVDKDTLYIPDASVNCGDLATNDTRALPQPLIVVEVTSPSTARADTTDKFEDYFRVPSIQHYLQVNLSRRVVLHHRRQEGGGVFTTIIGAGPLALDPPGLTIQVEDLFEA